MKIGALSFETMSSPADNPYNVRVDAKYKGQADFKSDIKLNKEISHADLDQMSKAFLIIG